MSPLGTLGGPLGGTLGGVNPIGGSLSAAAGNAAGLVLQAVSSWVLGATRSAIEEVASMIARVTAPNLDSTWFSATYWRVAALAAMLTLPFLCAAAVQAVARADLSLLARVAFGYLPLAILGVSLAAPLTKLLLAATDQMSAAVSANAPGGGARFLDLAAQAAGAMAVATGGSPFFGVVVGLLAVLGALALTVELLVRAAAVYVVVLMLPLAFAALVWPARRVWAVRLVELLASLILSKFVIVAVLSLAGAAFASGTPGINQLLVAMSLITLATFAPWALMRILPFTELAAGAAGILRNELPHADTARRKAEGLAADRAGELAARLRDQARAGYAGTGGEREPAAPSRTSTAADPASYATPHVDEPLDGVAAAPSAPDLQPEATAPAEPSIPPDAAVPAGTPAGPAADTPATGELPFNLLPVSGKGVRLDDQLPRPSAPPPDSSESPR